MDETILTLMNNCSRKSALHRRTTHQVRFPLAGYSLIFLTVLFTDSRNFLVDFLILAWWKSTFKLIAFRSTSEKCISPN
jgi:hypothetical protein